MTVETDVLPAEAQVEADDADKAIYWLIQFYRATTRQGWEEGMTEGEVQSRVIAFLCNRGLDPNTNKGAVKKFLAAMESKHKVIS